MIYENKIKNNERKLLDNSKKQMDQFEKELSFAFGNEDDKAIKVLNTYLNDLKKENKNLKNK